MYPRITLALFADEGRRDALAEFVLDHRPLLAGFHLVAPVAAGALVQRRAHLAVAPLAPTAPAGDSALAQLAGEQEIQAVIFFRDPLAAGAAGPDFADLLRVCDCQEIPLATNPATAEALLYFLHTSPNRGIIAARAWGRVPVPPEPPPWGRSLITTDLQGF